MISLKIRVIILSDCLEKGITDSTQLPSLIESDEEDEKDKTSNYLMFQSSLQNKLKGK